MVYWLFAMCTRIATRKITKLLLGAHNHCTRLQLLQPCECHSLVVRLHGSTSIVLCVASTHLSAAAALLQLRRVPRPLIAQLHWLYCTYVVHPEALSRRSTSRLSVALSLVVRPVTLARGSTMPLINLLFGRAGSTSTSPCAVSTHHPAAPALHQPRSTSRWLGSSSTTSPTPCVRVPRHMEDHWFEDRWMVASQCDE
jgi:hypothetical protein